MGRFLGFVVCATVLAVGCSSDDPSTDAEAGAPAPVPLGSDGDSADHDRGRDAEPATDDAADGGGSSDTRPDFQGRADINPSGNRVSTGAGDLDGPAVEVALDSPAVWLVPSAPEPGAPWAAVLDDGRLVWIEPQRGDVEVLDEDWGDAEPVVHEGDRIDRWDLAATFPNALPDGRGVVDADRFVLLADPTDRYRHGVLGDIIEAGAIEVHTDAQRPSLAARIELDVDVVEGRSPLLGDADGDGEPEILVTLSEDRAGARLVLYDLGGDFVAESTSVGRGNRWRSQIAIAPVGPNGETEIIDVHTPHLGRRIEWFRVEGAALVRVAELDGYTNHVLGSRNLDLAIVADADGDGRLELVVPTSDRRALGIIARTGDTAAVEHTVELSDQLSSNVGAVDHPDGGATYAAGTADGIVRFWVS